MKMQVKLQVKMFFKRSYDDVYDIDCLVSDALIEDLVFDFGFKQCLLWENGECIALCLTPPDLYEAFTHSERISFSVTLPAKYWK